MGYGKIIATGLCVVFLAAAAPADVILLDTWRVNRDNFNNISNTSANYGNTAQQRAAKNKQEVTWYGDWSGADLLDLANQMAVIAGGGGVYGTDYWVEFSVSTASSSASDFTPRVSAFYSSSDWDEDQATNNIASSGVSWFRHDTGAGAKFWELVDIDNAAPVIGNWGNPSTGPGDIHWNTALLEEALVNALVNDDPCRGLRLWDEDWYNDSTYTREQWSGSRTGPARARLQLFFNEPEPPIAEPAGLSLVGLALLAIRKKRS